MVLTILLLAAAVLVGLPGLIGASRLGLLAVGSWFYREPHREAHGPVRFIVIMPAYNEERVIGRSLRAIVADRRPQDVVLVVADHCTDATAEIARSHGALVLERGAGEPGGRAEARQAGLEHARSFEWDAVIMLDADSIIEPGFFAACEAAMATGAGAVQARSESGKGRTLATEASLVAFTLQGITIPRGRDRLGFSVRLRGTGMAIRRDVALSHRFRAPASEDLHYTQDLLLAGVTCRHLDAARLRSEGASTWGAFGGQKIRYEAGRLAASRAYLPRMTRRALRHRDAACFEAAWDLAAPPFAVCALLLLLAGAIAAVTGTWPLVAVFAAAIGALLVAVITALVQARAGLRTWLALCLAPWYLGWKAVIQVRALARFLRRESYYGPTARV